MALSAYAANLVASYDYSGILPPSQLANVQNYPGLTPSLLASLSSFLLAAQPILEQVAQSVSFPSSVSYGQITSLITQGQSVCQSLDALSPAPILLNAELWDMLLSLQSLSLYPELFAS